MRKYDRAAAPSKVSRTKALPRASRRVTRYSLQQSPASVCVRHEMSTGAFRRAASVYPTSADQLDLRVVVRDPAARWRELTTPCSPCPTWTPLTASFSAFLVMP